MGSKIEERIKELGYVLPECPTPKHAYVPAQRSGNIVFASGQVAVVDDKFLYVGKVGAEVSEEEAYKAAEVAALRCISELKTVADLDKIKILKVVGFVNAVPEFTRQPQVIDGASKLFVNVFGENGKHARSAIGMGSLPGNLPVEVEVVAAVLD